MRRRLGVLLLVTMAGAAWLGCNALLGIETAVFDPEVSRVEGGDDRDPSLPDAAPPGDGSVDLDGGDAGPCADTQTNARHCGRCGHDCLGGLCVEGACRPASVATDVGGAFAIAIDETHVYWTNRVTQMIKRAPKGGGTVEVVFSRPGSTLAEGLAVRGGEVYFGTTDGDGGILRCPTTGCAPGGPASVAALAASRFELADGGLLAFATAATNDIYRCTLPCAGAPELVASGQGLVIGVAATPGQVFWSTIPLELRTKIDGAPLAAIDNGNFISGMVVEGDELVYAQLNAGARVALRDGGAKRSLVTGGKRNTDHVTVRDGTVFFNDFGVASGAGTILACPLAGCGDGGGVLANDQADPRGIAVDDRTIFWANGGADDAGAIMRLAR